MISIEEIRKALNMPELTDKEVLRVRNNLYETIVAILDDMYEHGEIPKRGKYKD